jgi:serine/threonine protein kinase/tetratricopeptide (TPR) repeat protein
MAHSPSDDADALSTEPDGTATLRGAAGAAMHEQPTLLDSAPLDEAATQCSPATAIHDLPTMPGSRGRGWVARHEARTLAGTSVESDVDATLSYMMAGRDGRVVLHGEALDDRLTSGFCSGRILQDRYALEKELGRGGMGLVFLGRDRRLDRPVAIKVILPRDAGPGGSLDGGLRASFAEEARIGASLTHPAIATVFDYGFQDDKPFAVFEYIPGETLRDLLKARSRLPLDEVRLIVGSLAQALDFAHGRHVVHRDLKPENIRATEQGQFKILDLGLAKDFHRQVDWTFCGTPAYASPEQAAGLPCDGRTDQYALAIIAYEMLTSRRVFESNDWITLLDMHLSKEPPSPAHFQPDLPDSVCAALIQALQKDPNKRYASCEEFAVALGSQLLSARAPLPEIIIEADCKQMRGRLTSRHVPFLRSPLIKLALSADTLWVAYRNEITELPLATIAQVSRGRFSKKLRLRFEGIRGKPKQWFALRSRKDCRRWVETLEGVRSKKSPPNVGHTIPNPRVEPVVLLPSRPSTRFQLLGHIEAKARKRRSARAGLQIRGAMMGADAVADFQEERIVGFSRTERRISGVAIRAVDQEGRLELKARWFASQATQIGNWMLFVLSFMVLGSAALVFSEYFGSLTGRNVTVSSAAWSATGTIGNALMRYSPAWFLMIALGLRFLQWPQLARPAAFAFYGYGAKLLLGILAGILVALATGNLVTMGLMLAFSVIGMLFSITYMYFYLFLANRAWRSYGEYRATLRNEEIRVPLVRRVVGSVAWSGSCFVALALVVVGALEAGNAIFESRTPKGQAGVQELRSLLSGDPDHFKALGTYATATQHNAAGKFAEAGKSYEECLALREAMVARDASAANISGLATVRNDLAWLLATNPDLSARDPKRACDLSVAATTSTPNDGNFWNTRAVAEFRAGRTDDALRSFERSMKLRSGGDAADWLFLAMIYHQRGDAKQARSYFDRSVASLAKHGGGSAELRRFRAEAEQALGVRPAK